MYFIRPTYSTIASTSPMWVCHWPKLDATPQSKLTMPSILQSLTCKWLPYAFIRWYLNVVVFGRQLRTSTSRSSMGIPWCRCSFTTLHTHSTKLGKLTSLSTLISSASFFFALYLLKTNHMIMCKFQIATMKKN